MKIYKTKGSSRRFSSPYTYYFINDEAVMFFDQGENGDLSFTVESNLEYEKEEYTFAIKKSEFKEVYDLITNMLESMKKRNDEWVKRAYECGSKIDMMPEYRELFEKGYFYWKSDAPANEDELGWERVKKYNYLSIIPHDDEYELVFTIGYKSIWLWGDTVSVNTDRSRYNVLRFDVWDFFILGVGCQVMGRGIKQMAEHEIKNIRN